MSCIGESQTWRADSQQSVLIYVAEGGTSVLIVVTSKNVGDPLHKAQVPGQEVTGQPVSSGVELSDEVLVHMALRTADAVCTFLYLSLYFVKQSKTLSICLVLFQLQRLSYILSYE